MQWQLFVVANIVISAFRSIQSGKIGKYKYDTTIYATTASFIAQFIIALLFVFFAQKTVDHRAAWDARYFLVLGAFLYTTLNILFLALFRLASASIVVLVSLSNPVAVLLVATLFAGEELSIRQWSGVIVIFIAVLLSGILSSRSPNSKKQKSRAKAIHLLGLSLIVAGMYGFAVVNEKYLIDRIELPTYFLYGVGTQLIIAVLYTYFLRSRVRLRLPTQVHFHVWLYAGLLALSGLFFLLSLRYSGSSSLTAMGSSAKVALTVVLAYFLLHEREDLTLKVTSLAISSVGLYLLFS